VGKQTISNGGKKNPHASPINETYFTNILLQNIFNIKIRHWLFKQNLISLHATFNEKNVKLKNQNW
jgi:hypothetical protein